MAKKFEKRLKLLETVSAANAPRRPSAKDAWEFVKQEYAWLQKKGPEPRTPELISPLVAVWEEQVEMVRRHYPGEPDPAVHPEDAALWWQMVDAKQRVDEEWSRNLARHFPEGVPAELLEDLNIGKEMP